MIEHMKLQVNDCDEISEAAHFLKHHALTNKTIVARSVCIDQGYELNPAYI